MIANNQYVPPEGPEDAEIIVIGESPWRQEVYNNRPFAGQSGKKLEWWWDDVGLKRGELYVMNLYPFKPPRIDVDSIPRDTLVEWMDRLHDRIANLKGPKVLVPLGNYATYALTGKGKVKAAVRNAFTLSDVSATKAEKEAGITKLRGSVYPYRDRRGREMTVVPSIHPSAVLQTPKWEKRCIFDWQRVVRECGKGRYDVPARKHIVDPDEWQVEEFVRLVEKWGREFVIAVDIETWGNQLSCVGFAINPHESITIPLIGRDRDRFFDYVKRLCEAEGEKVLCNGFFDYYWLAWYGICLRGYVWDVQLMYHAIDAADNYSLDYLASLFCEGYMFWKDESKSAEEIIKYAHDAEALWTYNGLDCCYTNELYWRLRRELEKEGMEAFYRRHYQAMIEPISRTMLHGMRVDKKAQKEWGKRLRREMKEIHQELNEAAGFELFATEEKTALREPEVAEWEELLGKENFNEFCLDRQYEKLVDSPPDAKFIDREARARLLEKGFTYMMSGQNAGKIRYKKVKVKKDFSNDKLKAFFYDVLGLPKQTKVRKGKNGKSRSVSLDEGVIRKMTAKWPGKIGNYGNLLLAYREKKKELDYMKGAWDSDGRIRCSYKMLTEAGRLASSKNPRGSGYNIQNIKR